MKIYNGYERLARNYTLVTDEYEFTMARGYLANGKQVQEAVFDVFFRAIPNGGGYAVMAGLDKIIPYIQNLKFIERDIESFRRRGYPESFLNYLRNFKFTGDIYAVPDGTPVFPNEPIITVKAPLIEAQIIETTILTTINGAMEHATGARKIMEAVPNGVGVMEFGARRADGPEAAIDSSIYGIMAGCMGTSNVMVADMLNIKPMGTHAHSWVQSFPTEYEAFMAYAKEFPDNCILLVDTVDTLRSGVPNAINVAKEFLIPNGYRLKGIRIDSGDLAYLSKEARKMLDAAGLTDTGIVLSNGLKAETIESLTKQKAVFGSLGVGDNISKPDGRMGCVYKEVSISENGQTVPKIKKSNDPIKTTNPGYKKLYRAYDNETGYALADIMTRYGEKVKQEDLLIIDVTNFANRRTINDFRLEELQKPIFINGELVYYDPEIMEKRAYCAAQMATLYPEVKRVEKPHQYYVDGTEDYINFKQQMVDDAEKQLVKIK